MKNSLILSFLPIIIISSQVFAIAGFGLNLDQSIFNVTTYSDSLIGNNNQKAPELNLSFNKGYFSQFSLHILTFFLSSSLVPFILIYLH